jgi:hypothetical protein
MPGAEQVVHWCADQQFGHERHWGGVEQQHDGDLATAYEPPERRTLPALEDIQKG